MASMAARLLDVLRRLLRRREELWVRPSNTVTRWLNGTIEAPPPPPADVPSSSAPAASAEEERPAASDAA
jgi:hypothetical protein